MNMQNSDAFQNPPLELTCKSEALAYPINALHDGIRLAVLEVQNYVQAPVALVAATALSAVSAVAQGHVDVERDAMLKGPCSLYMLTVAESGERKSTCDGFFTGAITDWQNEKALALAFDINKAKADLSTWQAEYSGIQEKIKKNAKDGKASDAEKKRLQELENGKPKLPVIPQILRGDDTPENLAFCLATKYPVGALLSSEAGLVFGAHGMNKDNIMKNLSLLNILWDGKEGYSVGRKSSDSFTIRNGRFTIGLQIQEAPLKEFLGKNGELTRGIGFLARFLFCMPDSTQGTRLFKTAPNGMPHLAKLNARITEILNIPLPYAGDEKLTPKLLKLSPEAKTIWVNFHNKIERELAPGRTLADCKDIAAKIADNAARLAGLFHVFEHSFSAQIDAENMERACAIAAYHLSAAKRFYGEIALPEYLQNAIKLERWILGYCKEYCCGKISKRKITQFGPNSLREKDRLENALSLLEEHNRIRIIREGNKSEILVHPALLV